MIFKRDIIVIFILSILFSLAILLIERLLNINYDFHPDSTTYLINSNNYIESFYKDPSIIFGTLYYFVVNLFNSEINFLITLNILIFAFTNLILFSKIRNVYRKNGLLFYFAVLIIIFDPYRGHLSVHILKDTLVIFSVTLLFFSSNILFKIFGLFLGFLTRLGFFMYLPNMLSGMSRLNNILFLFIFLFFLFFYKNYFILAFSKGQSIDMSFRTFDLVYNFIEIGYPIGDILRSISWPFIRLTGLAFIFHPIYFLFFINSLAIIYIVSFNFNYLKKNIFLLLISFAAFAFVTSGYNSYLRWTQPLMTVFPIWVIVLSLNLKHNRIKF